MSFTSGGRATSSGDVVFPPPESVNHTSGQHIAITGDRALTVTRLESDTASRTDRPRSGEPTFNWHQNRQIADLVVL
jgi:hypothetical protein